MGQHHTTDYGGSTLQTTNATLTPAAWFRVQPGHAYLVEAHIFAVDSGFTQAAGYVIRGLYLVTAAGVITLVGSLNSDASIESDSNWAATLAIADATSGAAAGTGPYIRADVTGEADITINWHASLRVCRVGFQGDKA